METRALIAFGSNQGNAPSIYRAVQQRLDSIEGIETIAASQLVQTAAVGGPQQPDYANAAILVATVMTAQELHDELARTESALGRTRRIRWGPRTVDLDLLLFGNLELQERQLIVPHPRMSFRRFVLQPAVEVAGEMVHPPSGLSLSELLARLDAWAESIVWISDRVDAIRPSVLEPIRQRFPGSVLQLGADLGSLPPDRQLPGLLVWDQPGEAPRLPVAILVINHCDLEEAAHEVTAAIDAMQGDSG